QTHPFALYAMDWDNQGRVETIQIVDAATNAQLDSRTLSNFGKGTYLVWNISGHVTINVTFSGGPNAVISGIFFGTAPSSSTPILSITKTHTGNFAPGQQNAAYTVTVSNASNAAPSSEAVTVAETMPPGLELVSMAGAGWTCTVNTGSCTRSDALSGGLSYTPITVTVNVAAAASSPQVNQVTVSGGGSAPDNASDPTTISAVNTGGASAVFLFQDTKTQGSWQTQYGADGYSLANSAENLPVYDPSFAVQNAQSWAWAASTTDARALQLPGSSGRIAATWYSARSFSLDVITGTSAHQVALYAVDWDNRGRSETIEVFDANSNAPLDAENISNFSNGQYLVWNVTGHVKITITSNSGPNAVVSGVFFGSGGVSVTPASATAVWDGSDVGTQGNWMNLYGSGGYSLANAGQSFSIPVTFAVQKQSNWTWASSRADPRALQTDSQGDRIAAAWYSSKTFSFDINLTDGQAHQVALYVVDWDNKG
ncbi:MAG: hypothetical protein ACRD4Q_12510, partial [Candidatus Acidiferrales bacterium]